MGAPPSPGVESSHDDSTPPLCFGVESSCHHSTPPPAPHRGSNRPVTTQPPRPLCGRSSRLGKTRPPPPLLGGPSWVFYPLHRPRGPPPPTPLRGDRGTLQRPYGWRPRGPQRFPSLPRGLHSPNPGGLPFPRRVLLRPISAPRLPPSAVTEVPFPPPLQPALIPTCSPRAPLSCMAYGDTVSGVCASLPSSDSASDVSYLLPLSPIHPSLLSPPRSSSPHLPGGPAAAHPRPRNLSPGPSRRYRPKGQI